MFYSCKCLPVIDSELGPGYRSAMQESALIVSLQMFNILLERTNQLLIDQQNNTYKHIVSDDVQTLLPAIKVSRSEDIILVYYNNYLGLFVQIL